MEYIEYKICNDTSSLVTKIKWCEGDLHITFRTTNKTYTYSEVEKDMVLELISSASIGQFFNENIKNNYTYCIVEEPEQV